ncbi:hypothetical protein GOODEAATRI_026727, partial [Goodea atripinnis]
VPWLHTVRSIRITSLFLHSAPVSSAPPDPKVATLSLQLDQLDTDLANIEESMLSQLRTPVSRSDPAGDLAKKLKVQKVYEANAHKYNSTLEDVGMTLPQRVQMFTLADAIGKE